MDNVNPQVTAPGIGPWPCSGGTCVDIVEGGDTFAKVVSTRRVEQAGTDFDADEIVKFFDEVKAGVWDGLYARALAAAKSFAKV